MQISYTEFHTHRSRNMGTPYRQKFIYTPKYSMTVTNLIFTKLMFVHGISWKSDKRFSHLYGHRHTDGPRWSPYEELFSTPRKTPKM